ncbi:MAG TPA: hypothetical protein PKA27_13680 [Fimbriimonadaceae bacterium]|nr:hypothetical protein [Fimbriimonadaceae bacterium]
MNDDIQVVSKESRTQFPFLLWLVPVLAVAAIVALWTLYLPGVVAALSLLVVLPIGFLMFSLAFDEERQVLWLVAVVSAFIGGTLIIPTNLPYGGLTRARLEKLINVGEYGELGQGVYQLIDYTDQDYMALSAEMRRRAAVQLWKFKLWKRGQTIWASSVTTAYQEREMRISSLAKTIAESGISQFRLKQLCEELFEAGLSRPSLDLWKAHYSDVVPGGWEQRLRLQGRYD